MTVCRALATGGPDAALAAVAAGSVRLCRLVNDGGLLWSVVFKTLLQVSINLQLVNVFGRRVVRWAIYTGPAFYSDIAEAA